jgi:hypothetical protein
MRKRLIFLMASLFAISAYAQIEDGKVADIDWTEDSTEVTTIQDIVKQQQILSLNNSAERHFADVWGRRSYINFSYNTTTLSPQGTVPTGINGGTVNDMKSDWGASFQYGRSYRLHKLPISNFLQFCIDFTGIDLNVNHFKSVGEKPLYDSRQRVEKGYNDYHYYTPWNLEKYEFNYGMSIGPSITIAPFTSVNQRNLHYLKFQFYYHIGYHVSFLYMPNDKDADMNDAGPADTEYKYKQEMGDNFKMDWGHGLINSFGVNMSWKFIGVGYEYRTAKVKYKATNTGQFGDDKSDFSNTTSRIYLQLRL